MAKSREELLEIQRRLQQVYPQVQNELMQIPGVVKVGIGIKETSGELTGETVFRVYVQEKKLPAEVPPGELIPSEIYGFKTDVIIVRPEQLEEDVSRYRPLKAGSQINRADSAEVGTLGCFAHLVSDNTVVILSNHHVLYGSSGADGAEIGQPDYQKSICCTCGDIGANIHGIRRNHLDCAIARLKSDVGHSDRIKDIGFITGVANAISGETVKKRGRTTELTTGTVTNLTLDATGTKILEIEVKKNNGQDRFSRPGDSGSALLNVANQIIGLHKSGNNGESVTPGNFHSTSIGIQEVLDAFQADGFQITIITGVGSDEMTELEPLNGVVNSADALLTLEWRLKKSEAGRQLWALVRQHQREVLRLVNHERPVTVVWHRKKGPVFLAAFSRSIKEPAYRIPPEIEGITRQQAAIAVLAVLEAHCSEALRADLAAHSSHLLAAWLGSDSVEEMVCTWEEMEQEAAVAFVTLDCKEVTCLNSLEP